MSERYVTATLLAVEHCTSCDENFSLEQLAAFDPDDNDHCPNCHARGSMTTHYGASGDPIESWFLEQNAASIVDGDIAAAERKRIVALVRERVAALDEVKDTLTGYELWRCEGATDALDTLADDLKRGGEHG